MCIVHNKSPVEVGEAKELLDMLDNLWDWPVFYTIEFDRIHFNMILGNAHAKVVDSCLFKETFCQFETQVVFMQLVQNLMCNLSEVR